MDLNKLIDKEASISEILLNTGDSESIFKEYIEKKKIGEFIFKELHGKFSDKGFVLQDNSSEVGILSQCQCMQTLVSLAQDFGLDFNEISYIDGQKGTIRNIMDMVIEDVIDRVCVKNEAGEVTGYVFDASPYDTEHFSVQYSNIDAITWVVTSFFLILQYHAKVKEVCKWEDILIDIIKYGIRYINEAFIDMPETPNGGLNVGWNFTKDCKEPSLYFSFAVCECYLDMFSTFEPILNYLHAEKNFRVYGIPVDSKLQAEYDAKKAEYEKDRNREVGKLQAKYDEYNELARIFRLINGIDDHKDLQIDNTLYSDFEDNCKKVAQRVWDFVHADLADNFFYNDLKTTVTENELRMSTTSDVLFNSVYIINIMVGAGLDEKIDLERKEALIKEDLETARKKEREYDNLLESCLLAVQKAFRTYESLKSSGKDYIVDQFLVGFNEDFDGHPIAVNELRKLRMRCFSLLPMLIHTNNVVSEFLVKYPQYNMKKYLAYILDSRLTEKDGTVRWIWETDGFFSGSNYYFVLALNEFFVYHEQYEKTYIKIGKKNKAREEEIRAKHLEELQQPDKIIGQKDTLLSKKDDEIRRNEKTIATLQSELDNIKRPVEDAVRLVVEEEMKKNLAPMMADVFAHAAKALTISMVDPTQDTDKTYSTLKKAMTEMLLAAALRKYEINVESTEHYAKLKDKLAKDMSKMIDEYIISVDGAADGESQLRKFLQQK